MNPGERPKLDIPPEEVTARLKRACGLGDIERMATTIRSIAAEIRGEQEIPEPPSWQLEQSLNQKK